MKVFTGQVISTKMNKTATVAVERLVAHPVYKKRFKTVKKYQVHNELDAKEGDKVLFVNSKPYSKLKKWKISKVLGETKNKTETKDSKKTKKGVKKETK